MLDIAPSLEHEIVERAEANGMTASQYLKELMAADHLRPIRRNRKETPEETDKRVRALLTQWQKETGLPEPVGGSKTLAELSAEWAAEDANLTEEELAAERAFWEAHNEAIINSPGVSI